MAQRNASTQGLFPTSQFSVLYALATIALITAVLYLAQQVILPVALAILLAFLLAPIVNTLQHYWLGRAPAVIFVALLTFGILGGIGWMVVGQAAGLMSELPRYENNMKRKITDVKGVGKGSFLEKVQETSQRVINELNKGAAADKQPAELHETPRQTGRQEKPPQATQEQADQEAAPKPVPVVVQGPSLFWQLPSLLEQLASAGLVMVLVIFMLLDRGGLRNRLIRLVGLGHLTTTTKALDEAGHRVSRYLLMQTIINGSFGVFVGLVLWLLGLPHALLWGLLAGVLRFIPYVGVIVAILLPTLLSLAVFPGWTKPLLIIGCLAPIEFVNGMFIEPYLYGQSVGVSEIALLVAIAFWTWLWGPVGLLLATPLTVSIVVLGKYVPQLAFFEILMGDEPVMEADTHFYQRLIAQDQDEATEITDSYLKTHTLGETFENVLLPALHYAKRDYTRRTIGDDDKRFILDATQEILDDFSASPPKSADQGERRTGDDHHAVLSSVKMLTLPVHDAIDEVALHMLVQMMDPMQFPFDQLPATYLASEVVATIVEKQVGLLCLGAVAPGGLAKVRYLCKRLRAKLPHIKIVVGHWGFSGDDNKSQELLKAAGADYVGNTLQETCKQLREASRLLIPTGIASRVDLAASSAAAADAH